MSSVIKPLVVSWSVCLNVKSIVLSSSTRLIYCAPDSFDSPYFLSFEVVVIWTVESWDGISFNDLSEVGSIFWSSSIAFIAAFSLILYLSFDSIINNYYKKSFEVRQLMRPYVVTKFRIQLIFIKILILYDLLDLIH